MIFWVGITDEDWFNFLAARQPNEVNFWQPSGGQPFKAIPQGAPFLFKLHSPKNYIVGGGFFVHNTPLPLSFAWEAFRKNNGAPDFATFAAIVRKYRDRNHIGASPDPMVGCNVLTAPFFFPESDWIPSPVDWGKSIVRGKVYDTNSDVGADLWNRVQDWLKLRRHASVYPDRVKEPNYGSTYYSRPRIGHGAFRVLVADAYQKRCAITGERTLPVLRAVHIRPFAQAGPHDVTNGLLLRSDLRMLFDSGYLTVTPDLDVEISQRIKEEFGNGQEYYEMHGQKLLILPASQIERPNKGYLEWHNHNVFVP